MPQDADPKPLETARRWALVTTPISQYIKQRRKICSVSRKAANIVEATAQLVHAVEQNRAK
jgi:hypothetical protein